MSIYFVRVNGDTLHNNPEQANFHVPGEPPLWPVTRFNYFEFCLERSIARIGWPDTGDLSHADTGKKGALAHGYTLDSLAPREQNYLRSFRAIAPGSLILMPNKDAPGSLAIGEVVEPYHYLHDVPDEPYECAHRVGVRWDKGEDGRTKMYRASDIGLSISGGFWMWAFHLIGSTPATSAAVPQIQAARR